MEIKVSKAKNVVEEFKKICGPYDPSYAKKIAPNSIRALFGNTNSVSIVSIMLFIPLNSMKTQSQNFESFSNVEKIAIIQQSDKKIA